jgi:hypothetical protein
MRSTGSDVSDGKNTQSETKVDVSTDKELDRSDSGSADESVDASQGVAALVDSVEPLAVEGERDGEMKDCCDTVNEEAKVVSGDLASSKPVSILHCILLIAHVTVHEHG